MQTFHFGFVHLGCARVCLNLSPDLTQTPIVTAYFEDSHRYVCVDHAVSKLGAFCLNLKTSVNVTVSIE